MKNKRSVIAGILSVSMLVTLMCEPTAFLWAEQTTTESLSEPIEENMEAELSDRGEGEITEIYGEAEQLGSVEMPAEDNISGREQEYVVMAANDIGLETVQEEYSSELNEDTMESAVLKDNNIAVVTLTAGEADTLEADNNILLVEEDILLFASSKEISKKKKVKQGKLDVQQNVEAIKETDTAEEKYEWNLEAINVVDVIEHNNVEENSNVENTAVKVALLDSGVDLVSGVNVTGYVNFVDQVDEISPIFQDMTGHGTGIAGIIAGNGETGIYGVNPNVALYSVKIMDEKNCATLSRVVRGIYWCIENDIDIINMSFGTTVYSQVLEKAIKDAYAAGILLVGAAGNNGQDEVEYPAAFSEVMAVASTSPDARISEFSNDGEELDIAAPGEKIRVASFFDGNVVTHGTSVAVPHVVGVASLLWEKDLSKSNEFIRQLLIYSAKEIEGTTECGLLDANYALGAYDSFAENFKDVIIEGEYIPNNTNQPDTFEEINMDETYVEGRWSGNVHQDMIGSSVSGFTMQDIQLIKIGCVFPDHYTLWTSAEDNPRWHGKWKRKKGALVNYITVCELVTDAALADGKVGAYDHYGTYGLEQRIYNMLCENISSLNYTKILSQYGYTNTARNRKHFLYGCGIHTITDAFAHSTAEKVGDRYVRIPHTPDNKKGADSLDHHSLRHEIAETVAVYALESLRDGACVDGTEVRSAIAKHLNGITPDFRMIDIKKNLIENGYTVGDNIKKLNIDSSQTYNIKGDLVN